jgi:hypothetical protein
LFKTFLWLKLLQKDTNAVLIEITGHSKESLLLTYIKDDTLNKAKELLLKGFDEVMHYYYTIIKKNLKKNDLDKLKVYSNPRYWIEDLQPNHRHSPKEHLRK